MSFDKELDRLDTFLWKFLSPSSSFGSLTNVVKMLLILSHGQAQVERGFSVNSKLLVENLHNTSLISQRIVNDYMVYKQIKPQELVITPSLLNHVKEARSRYFNSQKERAQSNVMDQRVLKLKEITADIVSTNERASLLESTILKLKQDADTFGYEAEKKHSLSEMKSVLAKSNALKRAADEKQEELIEVNKRKKFLLEKKEAL